MSEWIVDGKLRTLFHQNLRAAQWTAVETGMTARGVPDSEYCFPRGRQGWIEFKKTSGSGKNANAVKIRPAQVGWIERRIRHGGQAMVGVRRGNDELYLFYGGAIRALYTGGLLAARGHLAGSWGNGPSQWDWLAIQVILTE